MDRELSVERPDLREKLLSIARLQYAVHPGIITPDESGKISPQRLFKNPDSFHVLELGAGFGELCVEYMRSNPDHEYTAFEIKWDRIRNLLKHADADRLHPRVVPVDFDWFFESMLPAHSFDRIIIYFPDPWPKRRHWKHRLIHKGFPDRLSPIMRPGADIYLATDYGPYARRMLSAFRKSALKPAFPFPHYVRENPLPTRTHFEKLMSQKRKPYFMVWKNE